MHSCMVPRYTGGVLDLMWDDVRFFLTAHREGSFSAAARALRVEQSTMSRRIARLEAALGVVLFDRRPDGLMLTAEGETLLGEAEGAAEAVARLRNLASGFSSEVEGPVRIACSESMANELLIPALPPLLKTYPGLQVEMVTGVELADLLRREADIALRNVPPEHANLVARRLAQMELIPCARADYVDGRDWDTPDDLEWVTVAQRAGVIFPEAAWIAKYTRRPPRLTVANFVSLAAALRAGVGAGLLVRAALDVYPELVELDFGLPAAARFDTWLITHRALRRVPRVRAVMDFLIALFADRFGPLPAS